jgi:membrane protein YqaA with SNARE-associated domain
MGSGGLLGYCIGHFLWITPGDGFSSLANFFFDHIPGFDIHEYQYIRELYNRWSYGILFSAIFLPIPYQIYSISAGAFAINFIIFALSTFVFQGLRFFGLAFLILKFGEGVKEILNKHLKIIAVSTLTVLVLYIFALVIIKNK